MYLDHFGLERFPFSNTPDTRLFYEGCDRGTVLEMLVRAITHGESVIKVVGEVGSGKTMICRMVTEELSEEFSLVYLANPNLRGEDISRAILSELGVVAEEHRSNTALDDLLFDTLVDVSSSKRRVVVLVEEAQRMPLETLSQLCDLLKMRHETERLLQLVLFGQPELDQNLSVRQMRFLNQIISLNLELRPLKGEELANYLATRLWATGFRGLDLFTSRSIRLMESASKGLVRRVNVLAHKAMLAAFADHAMQVGTDHMRAAIRDSEFGSEWILKRRKRHAAIFSGAAALLGGVGFLLGGQVDDLLKEYVDSYAGVRSEHVLTSSLNPLENVRPPEALHTLSSEQKTDREDQVTASEQSDDTKTEKINATDAIDKREEARAVDAQRKKTQERTEIVTSRKGGAETILGVGYGPLSEPMIVLSESNIAAHFFDNAVTSSDAERRVSQQKPRTVAVSARSVDSLKADVGLPNPDEKLKKEVDTPSKQIAVVKSDHSEGFPGETVFQASTQQRKVAVSADSDTPKALEVSLQAFDRLAGETAFIHSRVEHSEEWLRKSSGSNYSIQMMVIQETANLDRLKHYLRSLGQEGQIDPMQIRILPKERVGMLVLYGDFQDKRSARSTIAHLPETLQASQPYVRSIERIRALLSAEEKSDRRPSPKPLPSVRTVQTDGGGTDETQETDAVQIESQPSEMPVEVSTTPEPALPNGQRATPVEVSTTPEPALPIGQLDNTLAKHNAEEVLSSERNLKKQPVDHYDREMEGSSVAMVSDALFSALTMRLGDE
ncbi:MAG: AAA family ATPase [Magnetococcales bacterium]|nr:AAA family ATPase [Magnetococcales bacterium]